MPIYVDNIGDGMSGLTTHFGDDNFMSDEDYFFGLESEYSGEELEEGPEEEGFPRGGDEGPTG